MDNFGDFGIVLLEIFFIEKKYNNKKYKCLQEMLEVNL